jgi:hypothetical protein
MSDEYRAMQILDEGSSCPLRPTDFEFSKNAMIIVKVFVAKIKNFFVQHHVSAKFFDFSAKIGPARRYFGIS